MNWKKKRGSKLSNRKRFKVKIPQEIKIIQDIINISYETIAEKLVKLSKDNK